ncbi:MAG: 2-oxoglutarate dehydrogenase complex dihydrolipoyllysine-residue succinyltransferase [Gammaproteobacteria bacterium]|nr:2-oxoglutarate dehydrogenase complex dihydrolipoyllysine-residue succinyltransferase [Gammaproteobacteria bacterium]NND38095.1 2-oxoglutarate dehydrogenase complex dihydrolipoyllysine-residue succinyltransferase [Pseudomonadales bacterium]NNM11045.1 2-oxoglutarate dehydrogenase complex dihydrolipoyllysine-residue succinyltransferase [Pseudomonadales bacterium]RZV57098.1 MAG: 2-oxoglutarate dehydrogenase complex dihydrolipoyllysine-residue succinyltransferase [Pseudomonadales bacterium]
MSIEIKAPSFPESVADGTVATWHKQPGESCARDELIADIETDKVVIEVNAPSAGTLMEIVKQEGDVVLSNELIARFEAGDAAQAKPAAPAGDQQAADNDAANEATDAKATAELIVSPAAKKLLAESKLDAADVDGSGKDGRITKEDVLRAIESKGVQAEAAPAAAPATNSGGNGAAKLNGERSEKRVPMTRLRARVAERLLAATQSTAMLTTFNEVNMAPVMELRKKYKEQFEKSHNGTKLGFMAFFVKAAIEALRRFPAVNASIDGQDIVYHGFYDIGVAVSSDRGLVVPVLRDADRMSMASIESKIKEYGGKAQTGKLSIDEMTGGTFTISNGGVFGSMMSTPILNPPQAGILGMHAINERPMVVNGEIKVLPMMYLALSYDHRLIDGKEAVQFLVAIKNMIEDPARVLLEI